MTDPVSPRRFAPEELLAHASWVRELASHLVRDPGTADDLAQEALVAAIRKPPLADRPARPWLAGVLRKLALAKRRGETRRDRREEVAGRAAATRTSLSSAEVAARVDAHRALADAVASLAEPSRSVVYLHYFEGLSSAQIAERQGVAAPTVRWRLAKALDELRLRLDARTPGGRDAWLAALAPFTLPPLAHVAEPPAATSPVPAAVLTGVFAMTLTMKLLIGGGAALALGAFLWTQQGDAPAAATSAPSAAAASPPIAPREAAPRGTRRRGEAEPSAIHPRGDAAPPPPGPAAPPRPPGPARPPAGGGVPAAGARLVLFGGSPAQGADGDAAGRVAFDVDAAPAAAELTFVATAARCATRLVGAPPATERDRIDLGDVSLLPGGSVSGRVVDAEGAGVAGATVGVVTTSADGTSLVDVAPVAACDPEGRFRLLGAPTGTITLSAGRSAFKDGTRSVEVRAGEETADVVIVARRVDPSAMIRGVVLLPDGTPAAKAQLSYRCEGGGGVSAGSVTVDASGAFELEGGAGKVWHLAFHDAEGRASPASLTGVKSGAAGLELRLAPLAAAELLVTSTADGTPVVAYEVALRDPRGPTFERVDVEQAAGGVTRIRVPASPFVIEVTAAGFAKATTGPFEPAKLPERVRVTLNALPGVTGTVTASGAPVSGARVTLREFVAAGSRVVRNGFPCVTMPAEEAPADTSDAGAFALTLRAAGRYLVRVDAPGFAPAEAGPFDLVPERGRAGIVIALTKGGAIEGRVLPAPGESAASVIVGASRGDGEAVTRRTDETGAFRFDGLAPGPWLVRRADREIRPGSVTMMMTTGESRFDWSCRVEDGAVTHFDLDLRVEQGTPVRGEVRVDGAAPAGWTVGLLEGASPFTAEQVAQAGLTGTGAYRLLAPRPGAHLVRLLSPRGLVVSVPVAVAAAEVVADVEVGLGRVKVAGGEPGESLVLIGDDASGRFAFAEAGPDVAFVAGRVRLVRPARDEADPRRWPAVAEGELTRGGTLALDVPVK